MMQEIEQTDEEKLKMYMGCSKAKLAKMLIECNRILRSQMSVKVVLTEPEKEKCDSCGCTPSVLIRTPRGTFCQLHFKYA